MWVPQKRVPGWSIPSTENFKKGGGFKWFFIYLSGEDEPILTDIYFSKAVGKKTANQISELLSAPGAGGPVPENSSLADSRALDPDWDDLGRDGLQPWLEKFPRPNTQKKQRLR